MTTATPIDRRWWERAACADHPPEWWTSDGRTMWQEAVRICLSCPVGMPCLDEAMRLQEDGVVRAATLLTTRHGRHVATSLVCTQCGEQPARLPSDFCGRACKRTAAAHGSPTKGRVHNTDTRQRILAMLAARSEGARTGLIAATTGMPATVVASTLQHAKRAGLVVQPQRRGPWKLAGSAIGAEVDQSG